MSTSRIREMKGVEPFDIIERLMHSISKFGPWLNDPRRVTMVPRAQPFDDASPEAQLVNDLPLRAAQYVAI